MQIEAANLESDHQYDGDVVVLLYSIGVMYSQWYGGSDQSSALSTKPVSYNQANRLSS